MFVWFYELSWVIQSPLWIWRMLCHCQGYSDLTALNRAVRARSRVQGSGREQLRKGASWQVFWVFLLKDYEVWHDKMATGFKSNRTFILLYDYKWLGVKMSPFISTASYLGSVWFMLWIIRVFPSFWWSFADVPTLTSHFYHLYSFSPGGIANVISTPSLANWLLAQSHKKKGRKAAGFRMGQVSRVVVPGLEPIKPLTLILQRGKMWGRNRRG